MKFVSCKHKQDTLKARRSLKGSGIIITEHLALRKTQKHPTIFELLDGKVTAIVKSSDNKIKKMFMNSLQEFEML